MKSSTITYDYEYVSIIWKVELISAQNINIELTHSEQKISFRLKSQDNKYLDINNNNEFNIQCIL